MRVGYSVWFLKENVLLDHGLKPARLQLWMKQQVISEEDAQIKNK